MSSALAAAVIAACETHPLEQVEGAVVSAALGGTQVRSRLLTDALERGAGLDLGVGHVELDDIVAAFEALVSPEEVKAHGVVFTPAAISRFMAAEALRGMPAGVRVIDPAVGCGALLVACLRTLAEGGVKPSVAIGEQLFGVDVSADSVRRAALLLAVAGAMLGDDGCEAPPGLQVADSLLRDWEGDDTYDVVIGNPPYVRYQNLTEDRRAELAARYATLATGNWNLYFAFYELAHRIVSPQGRVVFIAPNQFMTSLSGGALREHLAAGRLDAIIDFGTNRVFDALTYTAITISDRSASSPELLYTEMSGVADLEDAGARAGWRGSCSKVDRSTLGKRPWRLVGPAHEQAVRSIVAAGPRLEDVAAIRYGIATCRDRLYLLSGRTDENGRYLIGKGAAARPVEADVTVPVARVARLGSEDELAAATDRILYPYTVNGDGSAEVLAEEELAERFPLAYQYLLSVRDELALRDRGKKQYAAWYAYGRTQGLVPSGPKLLTPLYAGKPRFLTDRRTDALFINGCAVVPRNVSDLPFLSAVLNSDVCRYWVERTGVAIDGGFYAYQKPQLRSFPVPDVSASQRQAILDAGTAEERETLVAAAYGVELPR